MWRPCGSLSLPSAPSPTLPGRHAPIDRLGQRFWPHVGGDVWLCVGPGRSCRPSRAGAPPPAVETKVLAPSRFHAREWHPCAQRRSADVGPEGDERRILRHAAATGPARAHVAAQTPPASRPCRSRGWRESGRQRRPRRGETKRVGIEDRTRRSAPWGRVDRLHPTVHDSSVLSCAQTPVRCSSTSRGRPAFRSVQGWSHV